MPKRTVDYSQTIIYEIVCVDPCVTVSHVGFTTNLVKRRSYHKQQVARMSTKLPVYHAIREQGGWDRWRIRSIAVYCLRSVQEARAKELEHRARMSFPQESFPHTLSVVCAAPIDVDPPSNLSKTSIVSSAVSAPVVACEPAAECQPRASPASCTPSCPPSSSLSSSSPSAPMSSSQDVAAAAAATNRFCAACDYRCVRLSDYQKHLLTMKHQRRAKTMVTWTAVASPPPSPSALGEGGREGWCCELCRKQYKTRNGLWYHRRRCTVLPPPPSTPREGSSAAAISNLATGTGTGTQEEWMRTIIHENQQMRHFLLEQHQQTQQLQEAMLEIVHHQRQVTATMNSTSTTTTTTTNNTTHVYNDYSRKTFHLNVFLNEQCKDAMNITDFVNSIQLQLSDLINVGRLGYIQGISNIITSNLRALDVTQRPIHCTDKKREVLYVKDQNRWEKEDERRLRLRKMIEQVACKNAQLIREFKTNYPDCNDSSSPHSEQYQRLVVEAMGGFGGEDTSVMDNRIIHNLSRHVVIDK